LKINLELLRENGRRHQLKLGLLFCLSLFAVLSVALFTPTSSKPLSLIPTSNKLVFNQSSATGHTAPVNAVGISPDGKSLATASADTLLRLWTITGSAEGPQLKLACTFFNYPSVLVSLAWSPTGQELASGDADGNLRLWQLPCQTEPLTLPGQSGSVRAVAFSPDGQILASGGSDNTLRLWGVSSHQLLFSLDNGRFGINDIKWSANGSHLAFVSTSRQVVVVKREEQVFQKELGLDDSGGPLRSVGWSPNNQLLAAGDSQGGITVWTNLQPGTARRFVVAGGNVAIHTLSVSPDNSFLTVGAGDSSLKIWKITKGNQNSLDLIPQFNLVGHTGSVRGAVYDPLGQWLFSVSDDHTIQIWDTTSGQALLKLNGSLSYQTNPVWLQGSKQIVTSGSDGQIRLWESRIDTPIASLDTTTEKRTSSALAASFDGSWLAVAKENGELSIWQTSTPKPQKIFEVKTPQLVSLAISPDGKLLAGAGQDGYLHLWQWKGNELRLFKDIPLPSRLVRTLIFSPDGKKLVTGDDGGQLLVWDTQNWQSAEKLTGHSGFIKTLVFSQNGQFLVSGGQDGVVRTWDFERQKELSAIQLTGPLEALTISPQGEAIATATLDGNIQVWQPVSRKLYFELKGAGLQALGLAFSPDGQQLAATRQDGALQIWQITLGQPTQSLLPSSIEAINSNNGEFVRVQGQQLELAGQPVLLKGFNFYPHLAPWSPMWQHWDGNQVAADLEKARELGANSLRVLIPYGQNYNWTKNDGSPEPEMLAELDQLISLANQKGMRVLITLFDFYAEFPPAASNEEAANWRYLDQLATHYRDNPGVLGWDLHNEPDNYLPWKQNNQAKVLDWLSRAAQRLRQTDHNHFLTIGFGNWENLLLTGPNGLNALSLVDVVALHSYNPDDLDNMINTVQARGAAKLPILLEEFGWPSASEELTADYSESEQSRHIQLSLDSIVRHNLAGGLAWTLWDFTPSSLLNLMPDLPQQFFGFVRLDGSLKPAAIIWQNSYKATDLSLAKSEALPALTARKIDPNLYPQFFPATGFAVSTPFKEYWNRFGGLEKFGNPLSGVKLEKGFLVQYFQNSRFEYHPEANTAPDFSSLSRVEQLKRIVTFS